jgi:hypothetical protein
MIFEYVNAIYQIKRPYYSLRVEDDSEVIENLILDLILSIRPKIEVRASLRQSQRNDKRKKTESTAFTGNMLRFNSQQNVRLAEQIQDGEISPKKTANLDIGKGKLNFSSNYDLVEQNRVDERKFDTAGTGNGPLNINLWATKEGSESEISELNIELDPLS